MRCQGGGCPSSAPKSGALYFVRISKFGRESDKFSYSDGCFPKTEGKGNLVVVRRDMCSKYIIPFLKGSLMA